MQTKKVFKAPTLTEEANLAELTLIGAISGQISVVIQAG